MLKLSISIYLYIKLIYFSFNSIDISSFRNLCYSFLKSREYGKYTKINTLEIIVENFEKKELDSSMTTLLDDISNHMELIKRDLMNNNSKLLDTLLNSY